MKLLQQKLLRVVILLFFIVLILGIGYWITGTFPEAFRTGQPSSGEAINQNTTSTGLTQHDLSYNAQYNLSSTKYDSNNYDVQYHDNMADLQSQKGVYDIRFSTQFVKDPCGNLVGIPYLAGNAMPVYYEPGTFANGAGHYVPNYEESVYLSKTTGLSSVGKAYPSHESHKGFCSTWDNQPLKKEEHCNKLGPDLCAATDCCILLGGQKCVAGNERGAEIKSNYSDTLVLNKEYYYYKGKCYGNC